MQPLDAPLDILHSLSSADMFSGGTLAQSVFYLVLIVFVIYSTLLLYHWVRYGHSYPLVGVAALVYFGVSFLLLAVMTFATAGITL